MHFFDDDDDFDPLASFDAFDDPFEADPFSTPIEEQSSIDVRVEASIAATLEEELLGAIITSDAGASLYTWLRPEHFAPGLCADAYAAAKALGASVSVLTPSLVIDELSKRGELPPDGAARLEAIAERAVSPAEAPEHARRVKDAGIRRSMRQRASQLLSELDTPEVSTAEAMARVQAVLDDANSTAESAAHSIADSLGALFDELDNPAPSVSTGIAELDEHLGGLRAGTVNLIAARPGIGKTTLGLDICRRAAFSADLSVAVYSFEMAPADLAAKLISAISGVRLNDFTRGHVDPLDRKLLNNARKKMENAKLVILDTQLVYLEDFAADLRLRAAKSQLDLVFVDYVQLMQTRAVGKNAAEHERLGHISRELKKLAMELEIPILAAAQLNRESTKTRGGKPAASELRGSGTLEQDADTVTLLDRRPAEEKDAPPENTQVIVAKSRRGTTGSFFVATLLHRSQFGTESVEEDAFATPEAAHVAHSPAAGDSGDDLAW